MEKWKKLKENKLIIFTIILAVLVVIAVGVIVYLLNNPKTEKVQTQNPANVAIYNSSNEVKEEYTNKLTDVQGISDTHNTKQVENETNGSDTEKYKNYAKGVKASLTKMKGAVKVPGEKNSNATIICFFDDLIKDKGINSIYLDYAGNAYLNLDKDSKIGKKYGTDYKIGSNIIKVGISEFGQDYNNMIWMINETGNVFYMNISQFDTDVKLNFRKLGDLQNIIAIEQIAAEGIELCAIDINGKMHEIDN